MADGLGWANGNRKTVRISDLELVDNFRLAGGHARRRRSIICGSASPGGFLKEFTQMIGYEPLCFYVLVDIGSSWILPR